MPRGSPPVTPAAAIAETVTRAQVRTREAYGAINIIADFVNEGKPADLLHAALDQLINQLTVATQYARQARRDVQRIERRERRSESVKYREAYRETPGKPVTLEGWTFERGPDEEGAGPIR